MGNSFGFYEQKQNIELTTVSKVIWFSLWVIALENATIIFEKPI
jgi:hypothetical protein